MPQSGGSPIVRRPHLFWIDVVRFFAVVSVMCGHWSDTVQRINGSDRFEDLMEKDAEMRLRRARSVGSQWTLPLLFYVSGLVHGFSVKKTTFPQYLLTRSWRLLLPLIVGWVLYVYPLLWLFRDFYYEAEVLKEASNFFTGLSQIPKLILRPGPMYLWFLIAIWVMGFINHLYFRCVALVTADLDRGDGNKSLWRFGVGMSLVLVFLSSAVIQYKVIDPGRQDKEVGLVLSLYLFAVPYVSAFGVALWYCQKKGQPVPGWLGPLIVAQQVALGTWHGGVAFHLSDVEMHKFVLFNSFYFQGFIDEAFLEETCAFFASPKSCFLHAALVVAFVFSCPLMALGMVDDELHQPRYYLAFPGGHSIEQSGYDMAMSWLWIYIWTILARVLFAEPQLSRRQMEVFGKTAYILYLSHWVFLLLLTRTVVMRLQRVFSTEEETFVWPFFANLFFTLPTVILIAFLQVLLFERTPVLGHLFGLYKGRGRGQGREEGQMEIESGEATQSMSRAARNARYVSPPLYHPGSSRSIGVGGALSSEGVEEDGRGMSKEGYRKTHDHTGLDHHLEMEMTVSRGSSRSFGEEETVRLARSRSGSYSSEGIVTVSKGTTGDVGVQQRGGGTAQPHQGHITIETAESIPRESRHHPPMSSHREGTRGPPNPVVQEMRSPQAPLSEPAGRLRADETWREP